MFQYKLISWTGPFVVDDFFRYTEDPRALYSAIALTLSVTLCNPIAPISLRYLKELDRYGHFPTGYLSNDP